MCVSVCAGVRAYRYLYYTVCLPALTLAVLDKGQFHQVMLHVGRPHQLRQENTKSNSKHPALCLWVCVLVFTTMSLNMYLLMVPREAPQQYKLSTSRQKMEFYPILMPLLPW